jgi:uncharacterized membrane protein YkvA (DUF1232 family)
MTAKFKVSFTLDESDVAYFQDLYSKAKRGAKALEAAQVIKDARRVVKQVRDSGKVPPFVTDAISVLADLTDLIQDEAYAAPKKVRDEVLAAIAYFSNPDDIIPDQIPGLGFLDDAIMIKFIEDEFKHELWGYRKFCKMRDVSEQRPWSSAAGERLSKRLESDRKRIRSDIEERIAREERKRKSGSYLGW